jgi:hypothetical protein
VLCLEKRGTGHRGGNSHHAQRLLDLIRGMVGKAVLLQLRGPVGGSSAIGSHGQQRHDGFHVVELFGQAPHMGSQLRRRLAILGHVVHARQVLGLAGVAFGADTVALQSCVSASLGWGKRAYGTFDLRLRQLSQAIDVILPRGVRRA